MRDTSLQDEIIENNDGIGQKLNWAGFAVTVVVLFFVLKALAGPMLSTDKSVSVKQMSFSEVTRGDFYRDVSVQGRLVAANSPTLFAMSAGTVNYLVKAGDTVTQNQILAQITSPDLENQLAQERARHDELKLAVDRQRIQNKSQLKDAKQAADIAEVNLTTAKASFARAKISIDKKLISQADYEVVEAQFKLANVNMEHAKQNLDVTAEMLQFELKTREIQFERQALTYANVKRQHDALSIRSPIDGLVGSVNTRDRDQVAVNQALLSVIDLGDYEVEINIPEIYADELAPNLNSEITINGQLVDGYLAAISPEVADGQVVGRLRFSGDAPTGLRQNQRVSVRVIIESKQDILKVKRGPFLDSSGGRFVYVVDGDYAVKRDVVLGMRSAGEVEVLTGLFEGEQLVISNIEEFASTDQVYLLQ